MNTHLNRRNFLAQAALASAGVSSVSQGAETLPQAAPVAPASKGTMPTGKIGKFNISRIISGGNLISGWCHQRDLLFVANLAKAYLTEQKQFDTLQALEENGVNTVVLDMVQLDILNRYKQQRKGKLQSVVAIRQPWSEWGHLEWPDLQAQIDETMAKGPDLLFVHGGYSDRMVQSGLPECLQLIGKAITYIRKKGYPAGLGSHALEVPMACDKAGIEPDFYFKTFHHDKYWSATPKEHRKRFCVDGPRSTDHNGFHDNIFCIDPEETIAYMAEKKQPWIAFKTLAAGAIHPRSGFKYCFENGADFLAVGMFDFEVQEDLQVARDTLKDCSGRERPWRS